MKEKTILDLTGCKYYREFHERIKKALDFPDYYGANWDAFWDCLTVDCSKQFVTILGAGTVNKELKPAVEKMLQLFEKHKKEWQDCEDFSFNYEIFY